MGAQAEPVEKRSGGPVANKASNDGRGPPGSAPSSSSAVRRVWAETVMIRTVGLISMDGIDGRRSSERRKKMLAKIPWQES